MVTPLLILAGWSFLGAFVWVFNVELAVVLFALKYDTSPLLIGLVAGVGQTSCYFVGYLLSEQLYRRVDWIKTKVDRLMDVDKFRRYALSLTVAGSVVGIPPLSAIVIAGGLWRFSAWRLFGIAVIGRVIRFSVLATFPASFKALFG